MKCIFVGLSLLLAAATFAGPIDDYVRKEMAEREIPGLAFTVIQSGNEKKTAAYGLANLEWNVPATTDTVFEIGSITKQFTAVAILMLAQDGKLSLNDPISRHLPHAPEAWSGVSVRQLLNHTSGVKTYTGLDGFELTKRLTQEQFINLIGAHPLDFQPGAAYKYSNSGYSLLGCIIENVSGKTYWDFLGERVFEPLGMAATTDREPSRIIPKRASGYEKDKQKNVINRDYDVTDLGGAGAIVSTVGDLAKWSRALDGESLLTAASKEEMWTPGTLNDGTSLSYGLGWRIDEWDGHKIVGHSGSTAGFSASFDRFPEHDLAVIVLCNSVATGVATKVSKGIARFYLPENTTAATE